MFFQAENFSKEWTNEFIFFCLTVLWLNWFFSFWKNSKIAKSPFEIIWPLTLFGQIHAIHTIVVGELPHLLYFDGTRFLPPTSSPVVHTYFNANSEMPKNNTIEPHLVYKHSPKRIFFLLVTWDNTPNFTVYTFWTDSYKIDHCGRRIALLRRYALSASPTSSPVVHTAVLSLLQKGSVLAELYYYLQLYNNSVSVLLLCNNKLLWHIFGDSWKHLYKKTVFIWDLGKKLFFLVWSC